MKKRRIAVGPGASSLILIAVVLALTVLAVLTMITARNDEALSRRTEETRQEVYALFGDAERSLADLDAVLADCQAEKTEKPDDYLKTVAGRLPEGMRLREDTVSWTEKRGERALECAVRILEPGAEQRYVWVRHVLGAEEIWEEEDLWDEDWDEPEAFDEMDESDSADDTEEGIFE